jgi:hypothetical protein
VKPGAENLEAVLARRKTLELSDAAGPGHAGALIA